ncbi:ABC transporter ATP-binding protein [Pseudomonas sp. BN414]|uniref:ABC transporter ATP-binding protein n=1 Tax=Pseudomonas sp. BN414 TaxID=2567888 RepID=UPI00245592D8|nr:ABC transporter ATP-binding protein [Pseudomonas sp. BN414]MDH4567072.1 ABC transporter ATP-binding protein [Pseudomonas sp. BN414]
MSVIKDAFVRFHGVKKTYDGEHLVVKNLMLDIREGEFMTLLGPSGSGKTTCLMMLAGFESASEGEIFLDGKPIGGIPTHKRNIGMVFQNYALFPHLSISENLAFPLRVQHLGQAEIEQRVNRALDMVHLRHLADRRPSQLSGGQQQRVAVARALIFEPKLVLMDEPLGALDKQLRERMQYEIKSLHDRLGITMVYVTHDQGEALTMSDRVAVFNDGVIQQLATPSELYEKPANAFVAQFIGENNRLNGIVRDVAGDRCTLLTDCGQSIGAMASPGLSAGDRASLSLRPERVSLMRDEGLENRFEAEVCEVIYHGDHLRTRVALCGRDDFIIKSPNTLGLVPTAPGERIRIAWSAQDCRALRA